MTLTLLETAEEDIAEAAEFLARQSPGLEDRFLAELAHTLERLLANPRVGPLIEPGIHKLGVRTFPYNVIYEIHPLRVRVIALAHHRRRPGLWKDRV
jgi:plasmid stabilization system protein ParE